MYKFFTMGFFLAHSLKTEQVNDYNDDWESIRRNVLLHKAPSKDQCKKIVAEISNEQINEFLKEKDARLQMIIRSSINYSQLTIIIGNLVLSAFQIWCSILAYYDYFSHEVKSKDPWGIVGGILSMIMEAFIFYIQWEQHSKVNWRDHVIYIYFIFKTAYITYIHFILHRKPSYNKQKYFTCILAVNRKYKSVGEFVNNSSWFVPISIMFSYGFISIIISIIVYGLILLANYMVSKYLYEEKDFMGLPSLSGFFINNMKTYSIVKEVLCAKAQELGYDINIENKIPIFFGWKIEFFFNNFNTDIKGLLIRLADTLLRSRFLLILLVKLGILN